MDLLGLMKESDYPGSEPPTELNRALYNRRVADERRIPSVLGFIIGSVRCRRRGQRRDEHYGIHHTDWYDSHLFLVAVILFVLSCCDAALTILLLNNGAVELNPIMHFLLKQEGSYFITGKFVATGLCIVILIGHNHYRILKWIRMDSFLWGMVGVYCALIVYELWLLGKILQ